MLLFFLLLFLLLLFFLLFSGHVKLALLRLVGGHCRVPVCMGADESGQVNKGQSTFGYCWNGWMVLCVVHEGSGDCYPMGRFGLRKMYKGKLCDHGRLSLTGVPGWVSFPLSEACSGIA